MQQSAGIYMYCNSVALHVLPPTGLMQTLSTLLQHCDAPVRYRTALCLQLAAGKGDDPMLIYCTVHSNTVHVLQYLSLLLSLLPQSVPLCPLFSEHALGRQFFLDLSIIPELAKLVIHTVDCICTLHATAFKLV